MQTAKKGASWGTLLILMLALANGTGVVAAQHVGETSSAATAAIDRSWPEVKVNVLVLDKSGLPEKVDEGQFRLFEEGAERPLQIGASPDSPVSVALMIDSSGSVFKRKDAIISVVKGVLKGLPDGSEVMVIDFSFVPFIDLSFTAVTKADLSFLEKLQASGPTALYDAVFATEDFFMANAKYLRRALVVLSDGQDNASRVPIRNVLWKMAQPGAPVVYSCLTSKANVFQSELMAGHIKMRFLAKNGGGMDFILDSNPESTAAQIADAIRNQYVLQFTTADPTRNGKARKLDVRLPVEDVQIHTLPKYFAPAK